MSSAKPLSWSIGIGAVLIVVLAIEVIVRVNASWLASEPIEYAAVSTYAAKLEAFRSRSGSKIAIVGDSVAYGNTMAKHGVDDWRRKTLGAQLANRFTDSAPPVTVANFALNGARPADAARIGADLVAAGAESLILVVGLRGFSRDFEASTQQYSYPWRGSLGLDDQGQPKPIEGARRLDSSEVFQVLLGRWWWSLGALDALIRETMGGSLSNAITNARLRLRKAQGETDELVLLLRLRKRFRSMQLNPERKQTRALIELLKTANATPCKSVIIYATENPDDVSEVIKAGTLKQGRAAISQLVKRFAPNSSYLVPDKNATPETYLDFIHPNPEGYRRLVKRLDPILASISCRHSSPQ